MIIRVSVPSPSLRSHKPLRLIQSSLAIRIRGDSGKALAGDTSFAQRVLSGPTACRHGPAPRAGRTNAKAQQAAIMRCGWFTKVFFMGWVEFLGWCETLAYHDPAAFTRGRLEAYQLFLFHYRSPRGGKTLAINTQLARLGCIRRFFAWLCRDGILAANPASDLDLPCKQARALPTSLSPEEIDRLLALPDVTSPFGLRDRTILELFYSTGVRRTEMTRIDLGDYDPHARTLLVRRGKNGKSGKSRLLPVGGHPHCGSTAILPRPGR